MILFTRPYSVIRRAAGAYVEGRAIPASEPAPVTLLLNVQPGPGQKDDDLICFAEAGALVPRDVGNRTEGDVVVVAGQRYIVTSVDRWDSFGGAETRHDRYTLAQEIPKGSGEV